MSYLYSSCFGSFVFDDAFRVADRRLFSDAVEAGSRLSEGKWLTEEEELVNKHHPEFFIGFKKEKKDGIQLTQDSEKLGKVSMALKDNFEDFYKANIAITKHSLKMSVGDDLLIIQSIDSIEGINKAVNTLVKRLREWYELYNPEFSRSIPDHQSFVETILANDREKLLGQIGLSQKTTMGADLKDGDVAPIMEMAEKINIVYGLKASEEKYLERKMTELCPNMTAVAGYLIGAKLLAYAGSTKRLAELPSSTIQLLGAEKALFRHITRNSLPPKYGVLHEHPMIARARKQDHGKVARLLADKISIAARVDYFKGAFIGDKLMEDINKRFPR
jgi:nucleolar protein 56